MSVPPVVSGTADELDRVPHARMPKGWNFLGMLIVLGVLFVVYPGLHDYPAGPIAFLVVKAVIILACGRILFRGRGNLIAALVLGLPVLIIGVVQFTLTDPIRSYVVTAGHMVATLFVGFTTAVILQMIYRDRTVTLDAVFGGICGYVLLAIAFAHIYSVMEAVAPGSFRIAEGSPDKRWDPTRAEFPVLLYSLLTLTTVGSDVLAPVSRTAQAIAAVEGVVGQFYIAIIVADLVGKRMSLVLADQPPRR